MGDNRLTSEELEDISKLGNPQLEMLAVWANKQLTCSHCRKCTNRCEVLETADLDVGQVEAEYQRIIALPEDQQSPAVIQLVTDRPELFIALRRCCFCGFCTAACRHHVLAADRMRDWRRLFQNAGYMPAADSKSVLVDNEWHIFSAYRAIYGIGYPEFTSVQQAVEAGPGLVDTLFFPGCSLVSYAPELMRLVGQWLQRAGVNFALSLDCCGSPLMSAGFFDRALGLRQRVIDQMKAAGITRMVTVCPGCGEEFAELAQEAGIDIVPLPELLVKRAKRVEGDAVGTGGFTPMQGVQSVTVFDSCHDRAEGRHGRAIRKLLTDYLPNVQQRDIDHRKRGTLCCGAGGAVAVYDPGISDRRVWRVIDEVAKTQAQAVVTMCPTCAYTIAQACLGAPDRAIGNYHYLELLFGQEIDWPLQFAQLQGMWSGEYGAWACETLL